MMVATEADVAAVEASVMVEASKETSASRKRFLTTLERAEEVVVTMEALVVASVVVEILEVDEVDIAVSSATLMAILTAILTKADSKDTTTKIVVRTCDQMSLVRTITQVIDRKTVENILREVCEEEAEACAAAEAETTLAGHLGTAWVSAVTNFLEMTTTVESVMKMMMPETCNQ